MQNRIQLSALGRKVKVGDLYNYFNDKILPTDEEMPDECKYEIEEKNQNPTMEIEMLFQEQDKFKSNIMGINSHLEKSIKEGYINLNELWFTDYFKATDGDSYSWAQVIVYCKTARRKETLHHKMDRRLLLINREDWATHLVEEVVYGTELICLMQKQIDSKLERKEDVQETIYRAVKTYINQVTSPNFIKKTIEPPVELDNVVCTIFSSLEATVKCSVEEFSHKLLRGNANIPAEKWRPIEILLHQIPDHFEIRIFAEKKNDLILDIERNWNLVAREECKLSNSPSLDRVPPLKDAIRQFHNLLDPLRKEIGELSKKFPVEMKEQEETLKDMKFMAELLAEINDWLLYRRGEIETMCRLFKDTRLIILDWTEIEKSLSSNNRRTTVFVLRMDYVVDSLMEKIKSKIDNVNVMLPVFPVVSDEKRLAEVNKLFDDFANKTGKKLENYCIGLMPSSSLLADGDVRVVNYGDETQQNKFIPPIETMEQTECSFEMEAANRHVLSEWDIIEEEDLHHQETKDFQIERNDSSELDDKCDADNYRQDNQNKRITEIFATGSEYSQVVQRGHPTVHLLEAKKTSTSAHLRRFEIGRPNTVSTPDHKVIILMGATGSGKSTLIDGMVNYILGVKWDNPYRFKIIREDESESRNQAHSQTSSVTAYTIYHQMGMAVPYSITIIDTPGYGDTRGVKRDKEITQMIHQFLSQQNIQIDYIHAACFVAASGDSRLTVTQRYIIDSVLSIFGKDIKENIRLLVTFADNADPPVVEACRVANFPVKPTGIPYSKFNSSVLYASNLQQGEDDCCFDQLFWDMGQENFEKFFKMLEAMNGCDLKSTRQVIQHRDQLEQSLRDIEREVEVYLSNIENLNLFFHKIQLLGHKIEKDKNVIVEKPEVCYVEVECKESYWAFNCQRCKRTCEKPKHLNNISEGICSREYCNCPPHMHSFQNFEWTLNAAKASKTLEEIKTKYALNCQEKLSTQQLLAECSRELSWTKAKLLSLLAKVGTTTQFIDSTALRSANAPSPAAFLSLMRSRAAEEQKPGYLTRLETLTELQQSLATGNHEVVHYKSPIGVSSQWSELLNVNNWLPIISKYLPNYN